MTLCDCLINSVWRNPATWRPNTNGAVLLLRAVQAVGEARVEGWVGTECGVIPVPPLPPLKSQRLAGGAWQGMGGSMAREIFARCPDEPMRLHGPPMLSIPTASMSAAPPLSRPRSVDVDALKRATETAAAARAEAAQAGITPELAYDYLRREWQRQGDLAKAQSVRAWEVIRLLVEAFAAGTIRTYFRDNNTGQLLCCGIGRAELWDRGTSWWTAEWSLMASRFAHGMIDRKSPNAVTTNPDLSSLYVDEGDFAGFMQSLGPASAPNSDPWRPGSEEGASDWANRKEPLDEVAARIRAASEAARRIGLAGPTVGRKANARTLAVLWREAGRDPIKETTFEQYLISGGH